MKKFIIAWTYRGYGDNAGYRQVDENFFTEDMGFDEDNIEAISKLEPGEAIQMDVDDVIVIRMTEIVARQ